MTDTADTWIAHNFTNCAVRPRKDREPFTLHDHTATIRNWHRAYYAERKAGRQDRDAKLVAEGRVGAPLMHLVEEQQFLCAELLDGLRSPETGLLADLVPVSLELLQTPGFVRAIELGWTANQLFGVSVSARPSLIGMGMAGFFLIQTNGAVPEGTVWGWKTVEVTLPDFGRKKLGPMITDATVPIWDHPSFRQSRH